MAPRRSEAVPTLAPRGRSCGLAATGEIQASRTSSRGRYPTMAIASGRNVGKSLEACTAMSIVPIIKAVSSSLVNSPLPPASLKARSVMTSPLVLMT